MMKTAAFIGIVALLMVCILTPVLAITVDLSGDAGLPYDDKAKYNYSVVRRGVLPSLGPGETEITYSFDIQVRYKDNKLASVDKMDITISGLPAKTNESGEHILELTLAATEHFDAMKYDNKILYNYGADFGGAQFQPMSWQEYCDHIRNDSPDLTVSTGSALGYPALLVSDEKMTEDSSFGLFMKEGQSVTLFIDDIVMPDGIFIVHLGWSASVDGEVKLYTDRTEYADVDQRIAQVKTATAGLYGTAVSGARGILDSYNGMRISVVKTADVRDLGTGGVVVDTDADKKKEEAAVGIPALIVVGAAGVAAAAAGIGAAGGGGSSGIEGSQKKSSQYKMYIYKEFGDSIRYDKPAVFVYARMAEVTTDGTEIERPDLTSRITAFSADSHMRIGAPVMTGSYVAAAVEAVSVAGSSKIEYGTVSFKFTGEGGTFQNNVRFRLVGEPYIRFEEQGEYLFMETAMLFGDKGSYEVPFTLNDFLDIPKVSVKPQDNSPFGITLERTDDFRYKALISNTSSKPEKPNVRSSSFNVDITGETDKENAKETFRIIIYPEGLSVSQVKFDENDRALFGAYSDNEAALEQPDVLATRLKIDLAVSTIDDRGMTKTRIIDPAKYSPVIEKLKGTDPRTENVSKVFKYEVEMTSSPGIYKFQPEMQIPEGDSKLLMILPLSCEYLGKSYVLELPVRLLGEPFNEMKAKQDELDLLLKRIKRYMPPEDWSGVISHIKENYDRMSPKEIRLLNRSLYEITARKLLDEARSEIDYANALDWVVWGLEWVKWVGDQAFAYLAFTYTGPLGEAVLSPAKDIMTGLIAENIWYREGITTTADKLRGVNSNLMAMLENSLMSQIGSDTSLKKAGAILAAFLVIKTVNHYYNDVGPDGKPIGFYDALLAGFGDLTSNAIKFIVSEKFTEMTKDSKAKEYFSKYTGDWLRKFLDSNAGGWQTQGLDIVNKYLQELCGLGAAKVYSKASQTQISTDGGGLVITFNLWDDPKDQNNSVFVSVDVMRVKDKLFDYIFDSMFAMIPFAPSKIEPPKDPAFIVVK